MEIKNKKVLYILETLCKNGFKALIAGGAVRDALQGVKSLDYDVLTDASFHEILRIFPFEKVKIVGQSFKICLVNNIEVCPSRAEAGKDLFPENDLSMRDFTINSMAYDPQTKTIIDLLNGKKDLENKMVCFTKDPQQRIAEDPLRIIRACRMASLINGSIETASKQAIIDKGFLITNNVARERIRIEIIKVMAHKTPSVFFKLLHEINVLQHIFPCLERCFDLDGGPHHGETVFEHCMMTGDAVSSQYPLLRLAAFLHDAGKYDAAITKKGKLTFAGHENYTEQIRIDLENLRFSNREIDYILSIIRVHMRPLKEETTPKAVRKILRDLNQLNINFHDFLRIRIADKRANLAKEPYSFSDIRTRFQKILTEISPEKIRAFSKEDLKVSGGDIMKIRGISQSPEVGEILDYLLERVLEDPEFNDAEKLTELIKEYK